MNASFFEILPHTADVRLRASGGDLPELFSAALSGIAEILKNGACAGSGALGGVFGVRRKISLDAPSPEILLVDFLSDVLTASYEERAVFCAVEFEKISGGEVRAEIFGKKVEGFDEDIKAVTYHGAKIAETESGFEITLTLDI